MQEHEIRTASEHLTTATKLMAWLERHHTDAASWMALIDPSRYASAEQCAEALGFSHEAFEQLPNLYYDLSPELKALGPRLFMARLDDKRWHPLCTEAAEKQVCSFLLVPEDHTNPSNHLRRLIMLRQPDGSQLLFRFQDTVVMSALMPLLTPAQIDCALGPVSNWMAIDVCSRPVQLARTRHERRRIPRLTLTTDQIDALDDALTPGTIIAQANETDSTLLAGLSRCEQWRKVRERQHRARRHGLCSREDIALYCVLSLQLPEGFDQQGPVARALERSGKSQISFADAIDDTPITEWREWDEVIDARDEGVT
ncbi:uncharacterized protein DUF4123 [Luteimonas cucumeris]|uniref:Uncharacterized protein DUF4123 n=1 Tax=Luteimonas cucumeris TaxID=985012 RepID=A0A562LB42_9GAMM|nr:DUF4123 domain-containing protein [Luteimonas cucumeris]TWI04765.1 uncharacterized protein DUF4123 [Luteimonas cucumeris]